VRFGHARADDSALTPSPMIVYTTGKWACVTLLCVKGSIFPKALAIGIPSALLCVAFHFLQAFQWARDLKDNMDGLTMVWAGYTTVLGVFLVFRHDQAYGHFNKGASELSQIRGDWFDSVGYFFSYCSREPRMQREVNYFQYSLVRLTSALSCFALQEICDLEDDALEIIRLDSMDGESRTVLSQARDKCQLVQQWIRHLVLEGMRTGVLVAEPPMISGALGGFTRGMVTLAKCRNITDIPFPFPYLQTLMAMLLIHWVITPIIAASVMDNVVLAAVGTLLCVAAFWAMHYIADELDQPFGEDDNDLPVRQMQQDFNRSLLMLMSSKADTVPAFTMDQSSSGVVVGKCNSSTLLGRTKEGQPKLKKKKSRYDVEAVNDASAKEVEVSA